MERNERRECLHCGQTFSKTYIQRHLQICNLNKREQSCSDDEDSTLYSEESFQNNDEESQDHNGLYLEGHRNEELQELYHEDNVSTLVDDATFDDFVGIEHDTSLPSNSTPTEYFTLWICIFLLFWQKTYVITDEALEMIIKFFKKFFEILSIHVTGVSNLAKNFPGSLYQYQKLFGKDINFERFVVCKKCYSLYLETDCSYAIRGELFAHSCSNIAYPNHPQPQHRGECGQALMYQLTSFSGKKKLIPFKYYCYKSFKKSFEQLINRQGFEELCELWHGRENDDDILYDVFDGYMWKRFCSEGNPFLKEKRHYAFMINVDWFCPFKHVRSYSVGAIYLSCLNLPRSHRFKPENVILVGLIPNMKKEPPLNTFIKPLVEELVTAWYDGFIFTSQVDKKRHTYKAALICVGCDIPATRKLCGFLGHSATLGCNKCKREFPGAVGQKQYGGFDRENWEKRSDRRHREEMAEILAAKTKGEKEMLERRFGTRYTVLSMLPYYDCIDMVTIDPMHNLFLGTSKHMIKIWSEEGYFTKENLELIQQRVDSARCSSEIGKLPKKIDSFSFDGFTADEFKNWTIIFSIYALNGIIPQQDLDCWRKFVLASSLLCCHAITKANIIVADNLLLEFCRRFERRYPGRVTPNMHMHTHIIDSINAYGPVYSFWLFSFERYNGILGNIPSNKRSIEFQLMKRFDRDFSLNREFPEFERTNFKPLFNDLLSHENLRGSLSETDHPGFVLKLKLASRISNYKNVKWYDIEGINCSKSQPHILNNIRHRALVDMYNMLYSDYSHLLNVPQSCWKFSDVDIYNEKYGSLSSRSISNSFITAFWTGAGGIIQPYEQMYLQPRPGKVMFYIKHVLEVNGSNFEHILACVQWYLPVSENLAQHFGKPVSVWRNDNFENRFASHFIPIQRIKSKFVPVETRMNNSDVVVVLRRDRYLNI